MTTDNESRTTLGQPFTNMARMLDENAARPFGGAYVIIPPGENAQPLEVLVLDNQQDAAQFFMLLKTKIEFLLAQVEDEQRKMRGYGR